MPSATKNVTMSVGGITIQGTVTRTAEGQISQEVELPVADAGTLSTRTSDTAGTLTLVSGHVISTGDEIDIFWVDANGDNQCAYGATVGTVAGLSVPFTGAAGTVLPAEDYAITVDELVVINTDFDGDDVEMIGLQSTRKGHFDFQDSGSVSLYLRKLEASEPWSWESGTGASNPLTGNAVDDLFVTNGDSSNTATVKLGVLYDSVP